MQSILLKLVLLLLHPRGFILFVPRHLILQSRYSLVFLLNDFQERLNLLLVYLLNINVMTLRQMQPFELFEFLLHVLLVDKVQILFVNVGLKDLLDVVSFFI